MLLFIIKYSNILFFPMKVSNSSGFSFIHNHPVITVVKSTPAYVKINPENKTKLVLEKRESNKKKN